MVQAASCSKQCIPPATSTSLDTLTACSGSPCDIQVAVSEPKCGRTGQKSLIKHPKKKVHSQPESAVQRNSSEVTRSQKSFRSLSSSDLANGRRPEHFDRSNKEERATRPTRRRGIDGRKSEGSMVALRKTWAPRRSGNIRRKTWCQAFA